MFINKLNKEKSLKRLAKEEKNTLSKKRLMGNTIIVFLIAIALVYPLKLTINALKLYYLLVILNCICLIYYQCKLTMIRKRKRFVFSKMKEKITNINLFEFDYEVDFDNFSNEDLQTVVSKFYIRKKDNRLIIELQGRLEVDEEIVDYLKLLK